MNVRWGRGAGARRPHRHARLAGKCGPVAFVVTVAMLAGLLARNESASPPVHDLGQGLASATRARLRSGVPSGVSLVRPPAGLKHARRGTSLSFRGAACKGRIFSGDAAAVAVVVCAGAPARVGAWLIGPKSSRFLGFPIVGPGGKLETVLPVTREFGPTFRIVLGRSRHGRRLPFAVGRQVPRVR